jgi:hypothetical protein
MTDLILCNLLNQRRTNKRNNIPPVRYTPQTPYPAYTQQQLNMRRKTEILKYNKNSTQGSRETRTERFALLTRGNYKPARLSCPSDYNVSRLSTNADVPGPSIPLIEDPTVPLYNYNKDTNAYAREVAEDDTQWSFYTEANIFCQSNNVNTTFATLNIRSPIKQPYTSFTLLTPIIFKMQGGDIKKSQSGNTVNASVSNVSFQPFYNDNPINNNVQLNTVFLNDASINTTLNYNDANDVFDYTCEKYIGILKIENIILLTEPGFLYTFKIKYNVDITTTADTNTKNSISFGMYLNVDDTYVISNSVNCLPLVQTPSSTSEKNISFVGISM